MRSPTSSAEATRRRRGKAGPELSPCGLGTWVLGGAYEVGWAPQDDADSVAAVRHAIEQRVNWVDTAPSYGFRRAEEVVGRALAGYRAGEDVCVFTRCGLVWDGQRRFSFDLRPESIRPECDASLRRLGVERIDLYRFHWPDSITGTPVEESLGGDGRGWSPRARCAGSASATSRSSCSSESSVSGTSTRRSRL